MLFNSVDFAIFLPIVFVIYWFITNRNLKLQNALIVVASYFFYGLWDWRFLSLIAFSTLVDFFVGNVLSRTENKAKRKLLLYTSIIVNLGFLGFFKYFNFFAESFSDAFTLLGRPIDPTRLNIILPVGISFYTFQTLSYTIDVYKKKLEPTQDIIAFSAFVSFFPQLVAGPIERATNLLPQFYVKRQFNYIQAVSGLRQVLWGLFKKVIIADNCATYANLIFNNSDNYNGSTLLLGALFFSFQIYGDFSGYSDIAIGTSRLFGFNLMNNFSFPYFSRDIAEFWRRWHISLSTWFRDYLYIPLGGSKGNMLKRIRNTFIVFVISGFWHGANWTFIFWGLLNSILFLPLLLTNNNRRNIETVELRHKIFAPKKDTVKIVITFILVTLTWVSFRAENMHHVFIYYGKIFSVSLFKMPEVLPIDVLGLIIVFLFIEWVGRFGNYAIENIGNIMNKPWRWAFYIALIISIIVLGGEQQEFIYFQF